MMPICALLTLSVVSHGHGALLMRLLNDLHSQVLLRRVRVLVTLNLKAEGFDPAPFTGLRIEVIRNAEPQGFGANHNHAFRQCDTEWFGILNPDLRVTSDVFFLMLAQAKNHPRVALMAPSVLNSAGGVEDSVRENLTPWSVLKRVLGTRSHGVSQPASGRFYWYAGMFHLVRSSEFRQLGGFDERYFLYCEDYDLCARMHLQGHELHHVSSATVVHDAQRDSHRRGAHLKRHLASLVRVWCSAPVWRIAMKQWPPRL